MSMSFNLFAETNFQGKWLFLGPYAKLLGKKAFAPCPLLSWSGWMGEEEEVLIEESEGENVFSELSDELIEYLKESYEIKDLSNHPDVWIYSIDLKDVRKRIKDKAYVPLYKGYVRKKDITRYEKGALSYIEDFLDIEEYERLDAKSKQRYRYYCWDDEGGFYNFFQSIVRKADYLFWIFEEGLFYSHLPFEEQYDKLQEARENIRLIFIARY